MGEQGEEKGHVGPLGGQGTRKGERKCKYRIYLKKIFKKSNQDDTAQSKHSFPTTGTQEHTGQARFGFKMTTHDTDRGLQKDINESHKEKQENTIKQVKELSKTIQDLKMEVETITKRNNPRDNTPRKEVRSHRCKHEQ